MKIYAQRLAKQSLAFVLIVLVLSSFTISQAAGGQFNVNVTVGADSTPPSTPTGLTATPISSSQIDLSWTASTDNVGVTGYNIYRDSIFVTTVPGTTFSDVGLSAATTYTYTVSAVDAAANESAQSVPATATTLSATVPPPSGGGGGAGGSGLSGYPTPVIYNVVVVPGKTDAFVTWKTVLPTVDTLSWGLTNVYEIGASSESLASTDHAMTIAGLTSGTAYLFQIDAESTSGIHAYLGNQTFTTLSLAVGVANASNFTATAQTSSILLNWMNPAAADFGNVRIVRSDSFYPSDPNDGVIIYEGNGENFTDTDVAVGTRYYYTLFVKYADGTYSSGLVASARIPNPGEANVPVDVFGSLPQAPSVDPMIAALRFSDFDFIQDGKKIATFADGDSVAIDGTKNLTVSLAYQKVPEVLKTIAITLSDPDDSSKTFSFLLRVDDMKTQYLATIAPLGKSGRYGVRISVIDYKNRGLKKIVGSLLASAETAFEGNSDYFSPVVVFVEENFLDLLLFLILLYMIVRALKAMFVGHSKQTIAVPYVSSIEETTDVSHDSHH